MLSVVGLSLLLAIQASSELDTATTFRCDFTDGASREMSTAGVTPPDSKGVALKDIVFAQIDRGERIGMMVGNVGTDPVILLAGSEALTFMTRASSGTVVVTTLFGGTRHETKVGGLAFPTFRAVMTRHVAFFNGRGLVSSLFGTCRALPT